MKNLKVVFMGTPSFAVPILNSLIESCNVIMLVCQPDRKKNRKGKIEYPETKKIALDHNIEVFQPQNLNEDYQKILSLKPDIIITCAYGQFVPKEILNFPKYGCINVHGSLLPELRGGAPIHWAIIRGYKETGITIMNMAPKMDAGDILAQAKMPISDNMTLGELYQKMSNLGSELLIKTLPQIINNEITPIPQDESKVTYAYNVSKQDEKIDFSKKAQDIKNLVRGLNPIPAAYCYLDDKRVKIYEVEILEYLEDYSKYEQNEVLVKNLKEEIIATLDTNEVERKTIEVLKNNMEKFTTKKITLKYKNEQIYVEKVEG